MEKGGRSISALPQMKPALTSECPIKAQLPFPPPASIYNEHPALGFLFPLLELSMGHWA